MKAGYNLAYVAFKNNTAPKTGWKFYSWKSYYNSTASKFIGSYTHCELVFRKTKNDKTFKCLVISIGRTARWIKRDAKVFCPTQWKLFRIRTTPENANKLYRACKDDVENGFAYDASVHCNLFIPRLCQCVNDNRGWCSQHVISRINDATDIHFGDELDQFSTSPQQLMDAIAKEKRYFKSVNISGVVKC
jgi:hypothetical protein